MNLEEAQRIMQYIEDSCLHSLRRSLLLSAARYAEARACWQLASLEERRDMDACCGIWRTMGCRSPKKY